MAPRPTGSPARVVTGDISSPDLRGYRLHVIASSVVDVVASVGGWLFDRAMAGWEVTVLLAGTGEDPLPIHILGGTVAALEAGPQRNWSRSDPDALAVAADLCTRDNRIRERVELALDFRRCEVALWARDWPNLPEPLAHVETVEYRLSIAARAFKARALAAAGPAEPVPAVEVIRSNQTAMRAPTLPRRSRLPTADIVEGP